MVWASFSQWHVALSIGYPGGVPPIQMADTEVKMQTLKQRPLVCGDISGFAPLWILDGSKNTPKKKMKSWKPGNIFGKSHPSWKQKLQSLKNVSCQSIKEVQQRLRPPPVLAASESKTGPWKVRWNIPQLDCFKALRRKVCILFARLEAQCRNGAHRFQVEIELDIDSVMIGDVSELILYDSI
jgi:hypothetical protein